MPRLVINPGTPQAWEIQLKPGLNFLGRGASNDFKLEDPSISGSHCQIVVDNGSTIIKDMGSTNGTYVNRAKVMESRLESGQPLRLGSVDMIFYTDGPDAVTSNVVPPPPPQAAPPPRPKPAGLKISGLAHAPEPAPASPSATDAPPMELDLAAPGAGITGTRYCKFHPKAPGTIFVQQMQPDLLRTLRHLAQRWRESHQNLPKLRRRMRPGAIPGRRHQKLLRQPRRCLQLSLQRRGHHHHHLRHRRFRRAELSSAVRIYSVSSYRFLFTAAFSCSCRTSSTPPRRMRTKTLSFPDFSGLGGAAFQLADHVRLLLAVGRLTIAKLFTCDDSREALIASPDRGTASISPWPCSLWP